MLRPLQPSHGGKAGPGVVRGDESAGCGSAAAPPRSLGEPGLTVGTFLRLAVARVHLTLPSLPSGAGHRRQAEARLR